jgi:ArsR family transcriptional regulator
MTWRTGAMKHDEAMRRVLAMQCEICKAMSHPLRLEIVELLSRKEIAAASLLAALETSKANLSKHMSQLIQSGIAEQRREGRQVFYRLTHPEIHEACSIIRSILYRRLKKGDALARAIGTSRSR